MQLSIVPNQTVLINDSLLPNNYLLVEDNGGARVPNINTSHGSSVLKRSSLFNPLESKNLGVVYQS